MTKLFSLTEESISSEYKKIRGKRKRRTENDLGSLDFLSGLGMEMKFNPNPQS